MARLRPTTTAQVSGHKFLQRRVEHGLVMGDIRMIHDPLARRKRAGVLGLGLCAVIAAGAGVISWLQPNPNPGDSPVVRTAQGQVLAKVDGTYHPVPNLVSAQLLVGQPAVVQAIGDDILAGLSLGPALGIADAPGYLNPTPSQAPWSACLAPVVRAQPDFDTQLAGDPGAPRVVVHAGLNVTQLPKGQAALLDAEDGQWVLTSEGRSRLAEASSPEGQVQRAQLPAWSPADEWEISPEALNAFPRAQSADFADVAEFLAPESQWMCVRDGEVGTAEPATGLVAIAGDSPAAYCGGLGDGGRAVSTGNGQAVVSATCMVHEVDSAQDLAALGLDAAVDGPQEIVRLLPQGSTLSREAAARAGA